MTRLLTIMGSGETAPTMVKAHRQVFERLALEHGDARAEVRVADALNVDRDRADILADDEVRRREGREAVVIDAPVFETNVKKLG